MQLPQLCFYGMLYLIPAQLPGAASLQPALPGFPWSSPLCGPDSCSFIFLGLPPASPWPCRSLCDQDFAPPRKIHAGSSCTSRGIPSPAGKAGIKSSATVLSHILKNCRQGTSIERVECVPFRASLCGVKHHLSPYSWFGVTQHLC